MLSSSSSSAGPQIGQKRRRSFDDSIDFDEHKPRSKYNFEDFENENLVDLLKLILTSYNSNWKKHPCQQKYYQLCRQIFVRKMCALGRPVTKAFDLIRLVTKERPKNTLFERFVNVYRLYQYENLLIILD